MKLAALLLFTFPRLVLARSISLRRSSLCGNMQGTTVSHLSWSRADRIQAKLETQISSAVQAPW